MIAPSIFNNIAIIEILFYNEIAKKINEKLMFVKALKISQTFWEPSWSHVGHQDAPKTPQDAPKTPPGGPQDTKRLPRSPQEASGRPDPRDINGFCVDFSSIFGRFLIDFGLIFH